MPAKSWSRSPRFLAGGAALLLAGVAALLFAVEYFTSERPNYSRIDDNLFLGGYVKKPPRRTRSVLNLCESSDPYQVSIHLWEPIRDSEPVPNLEWIRRMVEWIDSQQNAGSKTYVHCLNGVSRSVMVVTAYLMWKHRWTRDEALAFVRSKRPDARPNSAFMRLLHEWETHVFN